jgi:hypothetical protein
MTNESKVILALLAIVSLGASLATYLVMSERLERQRAELTAATFQAKYDQSAKDMAKREAEFASTKTAYENAIQSVKSSADVARALRQTPKGIAPLSFNPFEVKPSPSVDDPNHFSVDVPQEEIVPLYKNLLDCDLQKAKLGQCQADTKDLVVERDAAKHEAETWKKAAKGTKLGRVWFALKVGACAGIGSAPGAALSKPGAAAGGAAIAAASCALMMHW